MTDEFEKYFGKGNRDERALVLSAKDRAARLDGEALADPTRHCSKTEKLARFMAVMLEYDWEVYRAELLRTVRWLLQKPNMDMEELRATLEAKARDVDWLAWAVGEDVNLYAVRKMLLDSHARRIEIERGRRLANTTEARRKRYAGGKFAAYIQS